MRQFYQHYFTAIATVLAALVKRSTAFSHA